MKTLLHLFPILLFLGLLGCGTSSEESATTDTLAVEPPPQSQLEGSRGAPTSENQISGILQSSGLSPAEARTLGLEGVAYQLLSQQAYFLQGSADSLQQYLGQCVTLTGKLLQNWDDSLQQHQSHTTYNRQLFKVEAIHPQLYSYCHFSDTTAAQPAGREVTYMGTVARMQRPAPDIAYDYALTLQQPYRDQNHPIQPGKLVRTLPLVTTDFEVLRALEEAVQTGRNLQLKGIQHQGYAEQEAVWVNQADSLNL